MIKDLSVYIILCLLGLKPVVELTREQILGLTEDDLKMLREFGVTDAMVEQMRACAREGDRDILVNLTKRMVTVRPDIAAD